MQIHKLLKKQLGALLAVCAALSIVSAGAAELDRSAARVTQAKAGKPLTTASTASPETVVANYLRGHGRAADVVDSLRVANRTTGANGVKHVRLEQQVEGLSRLGMLDAIKSCSSSAVSRSSGFDIFRITCIWRAS